MPPNSTTCPAPGDTSALYGSMQTGILVETDADTSDGALTVDISKIKKAEKRKMELLWRYIILFVYIHVAGLYGGYLLFAKAQWATVFFCK